MRNPKGEETTEPHASQNEGWETSKEREKLGVRLYLSVFEVGIWARMK